MYIKRPLLDVIKATFSNKILYTYSLTFSVQIIDLIQWRYLMLICKNGDISVLYNIIKICIYFLLFIKYAKCNHILNIYIYIYIRIYTDLNSTNAL